MTEVTLHVCTIIEQQGPPTSSHMGRPGLHAHLQSRPLFRKESSSHILPRNLWDANGVFRVEFLEKQWWSSSLVVRWVVMKPRGWSSPCVVEAAPRKC